MSGDARAAGAALVAHSGGPTAVINASLLGLVEEAGQRSYFRALYGARFGLEGILKQDFVNLTALGADRLAAVAEAPSSALGTSRRELGPAGGERLLEIFRTRDIRCLFYTGGNGSMGTAMEIAGLARQAGYDLQVIGIPKTIDNDLAETDHAPGYVFGGAFLRLRRAGHRGRQPRASRAGGIRGGARPECRLDRRGHRAGAPPSAGRPAPDLPSGAAFAPDRCWESWSGSSPGWAAAWWPCARANWMRTANPSGADVRGGSAWPGPLPQPTAWRGWSPNT